MPLRRKKETESEEDTERFAIALIDYSNLALSDYGMKRFPDLEELFKGFTNIGNVLFAFVFSPYSLAYNLAEKINDLGFDLVVCQVREKSGSKKDTVDWQLVRYGWKFLEYKKITDIIVVSDDIDMAELAREIKAFNKKFHLFSTPNLSKRLKKLADSDRIYPVPFKETI
jgi:hypothetical protein